MMLKVCGITRLTDAVHAAQHGATALGFVFWPRSPRFISPEIAAAIIAELPSPVTTVGVFVNEDPARVADIVGITGMNIVQLHGDELPVYAEALNYPIFRAMTLGDAEQVISAWPAGTPLLLDAADRVRRGGTGTTVDWDRAAELARQRRVILAGGLTPGNVGEAIERVNPYGVDVSSGVEASPGVKDAEKVARFLENARAAFERRAMLAGGRERLRSGQ